MEPNKFEIQIKERLNAREIKPSAMAWDKLDSMLSEKEKQKTKFPWLYIAASFAGFLLIGTLFFNQKESVNVNQEDGVVLQNSINQEDNLTTNDTLQNTNALPNIIKHSIQKGVVASSYQAPSQQSSLKSERNQLAAAQINTFKSDSLAVLVANNNLNIKTKNKYVSAASLLADVSNTELESSTSLQTTQKSKRANTVSPQNLLSDVETEMSQTFRESAISKFNKNYNAIKTVLANRNYEKE
ncbi:hypothetical protein [Flavobacterium glaciei]|uniref:Uncharacterized protein n=1 Tax=Flavobacterium glaciei TaxID=386300 RepID=A0A562PS64_9FLAO|nr:hypothetical protein [Flavobacterium glaciei]RDI54729.1 hypothetical protein DFR66_10752 [Flavobacterium glaciei]TWI47203.1 hypothetical protein IQ02_01658 [Flavobacterium glaciei]